MPTQGSGDALSPTQRSDPLESSGRPGRSTDAPGQDEPAGHADQAEHAGHATHAEHAEHAGKADLTGHAGHATHAEHAGHAVHANNAEQTGDVGHTGTPDHAARAPHSHAHAHGAALARSGARHRNRLLIAFVLIAAFFVVEAVAGFATNSLALLSDAGHMFTDVLGLGMALAAIQLANRFDSRRADPAGHEPDHHEPDHHEPGPEALLRPPAPNAPVDARGPLSWSGRTSGRHQHTFGLYRLEILAAFVNALLLGAVAIGVLVEAVHRLFTPTEILSGKMLVVASIGLAVNLIAFVLLRPGAQESINVEGAYLEVLADTVGSVGVIVAALLLRAFGWSWVDPVVGVAIGVWILPRTFRLGRQAVRILLQAAPPHLDVTGLHADLTSIDGVVDVHDLHVWTLTSDMEAASAHLMCRSGTDPHAVLDQARHLLATRYGISHGTFQVEPESHLGCRELTW